MKHLGLLASLALAACSTACAGSFEEARLEGAPRYAVSLDPPECAAIDSARRNWDAAAKGAAIAAGASGISVIPVQGTVARASLIGAGVAVGIFAAVSVAESSSFAADWVRQCGATGVKP